MFKFGGKPQVKVEATDANGNKTTFYRDALPPGQSNFNEARAIAKEKLGSDVSIKVTYPR